MTHMDYLYLGQIEHTVSGPDEPRFYQTWYAARNRSATSRKGSNDSGEVLAEVILNRFETPSHPL